VIRIRYRDFSAGKHDITGLHGVARRGPRGVTVYLVPGLTAGERRAVLRPLRQEASRGFGPPLPLPAFAFALCADRLRTTAETGTAVIRLHPAVTLLPGAFVAAAMTLFVLASASASAGFRPGTGPAPVTGRLALPPAGGAGRPGAGQLSGGQAASPVHDRQLFAVDNLGPPEGHDGGRTLGLGNPAHGKCAAVSPAGCSAGERSAGVPRRRRDHPLAGSAGLGTVKGGVRLGHHRR
jgi:hypothetical protein